MTELAIGFIAVVEDDVALAEEIQDALYECGHRAVIMNQVGSSSIELLSGAELIVLDLCLAGSTGMDVLDKLIGAPRLPALVIISGREEAVINAAASAAHLAGFHVVGTLQKPLRPAALVRLIERRRIEPEPQAQVPRSLDVTQSLAAILQHGRIPVAFQPIVRLGTTDVVGVEALLAGVLPAVGNVSPGEILGAARAIPGGLSMLTRQVIAQSMEAKVTFREAGLDIFINVNLPIEVLGSPGAATSLMQQVTDAGLSPNDLNFELTEDAAYHTSEHALRAIVNLRLYGFGLALDDMSKGQSSLAELANLPVTMIKIDKELLHQCRSWGKARQIFASLVRLGRRMDVRVVAEGVETCADLAFLRRNGVEWVQGFLFGRKQSVEALLTSRTGPAVQRFRHA